MKERLKDKQAAGAGEDAEEDDADDEKKKRDGGLDWELYASWQLGRASCELYCRQRHDQPPKLIECRLLHYLQVCREHGRPNRGVELSPTVQVTGQDQEA